MKLSNQAIGTLMMALQKCLLEQTDIVPILEELDFQMDKSENLSVLNPPNFQIDQDVFKPEVNKTVGSD
mgnify:CR=1 FL=1